MSEILLSVIVVLVFFFIYREKNLGIFYPNTANIYFYFFSFLFFPFFFKSYYSVFSSRPGYESLIIGLIIHLFLFLFSFSLGNILLGNNSKKYYYAPFKASSIKQDLYVKYLTYFSIIIFFHQVFSLQQIPILNLISNDVFTGSDVIAREAVYKTNSSYLTILWHWNRSLIIPFLVFYNTILCLKGIKSFKKLIPLIIFMIINNSIDGSLGSVAFVFFGLFFIYYGTLNKINFKLFLFIPLIIAYPILFEFLFANEFNFYNTINTILNRISIDSFERVLKYYDVYGIDQPFLGGRTNKLHILLSGQEFFSSSNYLFVKHLSNTKLDYAMTGNLNANHIAYMYSDFGNFGVAISSIIVGLITALINKLYFMTPKTPITYSIFILQILLFYKLTGTNPTSILMGHGSLLLIIITAFLRREKTSYTL